MPEFHMFKFTSMLAVELLVLFTAAINLLGSSARAEDPAPNSASGEQAVFNVSTLQGFNGSVIHEIRIHGLKWTKDRAVRMLLSQHEGDTFDAETWLKGIHKLYDTTVLYDVRTIIQPLESGSATRAANNAETPSKIILIDMTIRDRWTLLPFGIAQAGGGSDNVGAGIADVNFLGYFTQVAASYSTFNGTGSYDFNLYQEFILDTEFIGGLDISETGTPVDLQKNDGTSIGSFTWQRHQDQLLFGRKFEPKIRLFSYFEYFQDEMVSNMQAPEVKVYSGGQYRVRPVLIVGRSELTNFLEEGSEFTLAPTSANFFAPNEYSQFVMTYKKVFLRQNTNYAFFFNGGAMTHAPIPYLFRLGGYDTVRGFSTNRAIGRYYLNANLEYRAYIARYYSWLTGDIVFQSCIFQDMAQMWNSADLQQSRRVNSSLGLLSDGIGMRFNFQRFAGAILRLDFARTVIPNEGWGVAFGVGQFF
jgi:outer membrane protein assembly factor BamA